MTEINNILKKKSDTTWEIPITYKKGMKVPAKIYGTDKLLKVLDNHVIEQITNVATLPGIQNYAYAMPDAHSGYGFPIGGVAAMDIDEGVISPGGIGFDINCGMRLVLTNLTHTDVKPKLKELVDQLYKRVPAGVGGAGFLKINNSQFKEIVEIGSKWCIENDYGWEEDLENTEEEGMMKNANSEKISDVSIKRGIKQIGTLGSGNHYLEIQVVKPENIFDKKAAKTIGIFPNQVVIMFHCGSRGFGHQVASDYLKKFLHVMQEKYKIEILDRELACAPFNSQEGQDYFSAMQCAINMSFVNRQTILHRIREVFAQIFKSEPEKLGLSMVYDVAHNTAKIEKHDINGKNKNVIVHRKGATRAFGPGREEIPQKYRSIGQPVIIGGSMETGSYLLLGTETAHKETFASTAHGSGRIMSRTKAKRIFRGEKLFRDMLNRGIYVKSVSYSGLAEEAGEAYKDIDEVVNATVEAKISKRVTRFLPIGNVKG